MLLTCGLPPRENTRKRSVWARKRARGPCRAGEGAPRPPEGDGKAPTVPGTWCPHGTAAWTRYSPQVRRAPCSLQGLGAVLKSLRTASPSSSKGCQPEPFGMSSSIPAAACGPPPLEWPRSNQHRTSASRVVGMWWERKPPQESGRNSHVMKPTPTAS